MVRKMLERCLKQVKRTLIVNLLLLAQSSRKIGVTIIAVFGFTNYNAGQKTDIGVHRGGSNKHWCIDKHRRIDKHFVLTSINVLTSIGNYWCSTDYH